MPADSANYSARRTIRTNIKDLYITSETGTVERLLNEVSVAAKNDSSVQATVGKEAATLTTAYQAIASKATPSQNYVPSIKWFGFENQYHRWISNFFKGDFGFSYLDDRPVANKMWDALRWTLIINFISILLAYILSIPIGISTAVRKDSTYDLSLIHI